MLRRAFKVFPKLLGEKKLFIRPYVATSNTNNLCDLNNSTQSTHFDIIIAGGGLIGTALACAIGKHKLLADDRVLLLDTAPPFSGFQGENYKNRVSAISHATVNLFKCIGVWNTIASTRYKPVKQIQVWDASSDAIITFNHQNFSDDVAYIVENDLILDAIWKEFKNCKNVEIRNLSEIVAVKIPKDGVCKSTVSLKEGYTFTTELLIGADGAQSLVRKQMDVETYTTNYNQLGLVATLDLCDGVGDNSTAWQRFLPTGPIALLPLNDSLSSLVWSTTPHHAKNLKDMPPEHFVDAVNEAFWKEFPKDKLTENALHFFNMFFGSNTRRMRQFPPKVKSVHKNSRACFPLGFGHALSYITQGAALVGDAAHRIHPLAGQGLNLGFGDVKCLVEVLAEAKYAGFKLGDKNYLLKYEHEQLLKNVPIMAGIHGIQLLYNTTHSPVVLLRSLGLQITQNVEPLKNMFMQRAMG